MIYDNDNILTLILGIQIFGLIWFYGISTIVGYLTPNPFLCKNQFYFKQFSLFKQLYITIQFIVSTVSMSKTIQFQIIQFCWFASTYKKW